MRGEERRRSARGEEGPFRGKMGRREFLKRAARSGGVIFLSGLAGMEPIRAFLRSELAVVTGGDTGNATKRAVELLGGMKRFVGKGDVVLLKPNMGFPNPPEYGVTTNPLVVREVAVLALSAGAKKVLICDNPVRKPDLCLESNGIKKACKDLPGTHIFTLSGERFFAKKRIDGGKHLKSTKVARPLLEVDVFINLPTAKSHNSTEVSLSLKNMMGLVENRFVLHGIYNLHKSIADLNLLRRPDLIVMDATRALVSGGPAGPGELARTRTLIAGNDPVAVDSFTLTLTPWNGRRYTAREIKHIFHSWERGIGEIDLDRVNTIRAKLA